MADKAIALAFAKALTGSEHTPLRVRTVHDKERGRPGWEKQAPLAELWPLILEAETDGYGIFYCLNETKQGPGSGKAPWHMVRDVDVTKIRVVAIDCDAGLPETWELHVPPSLIVRTSTVEGVQRGQILWRTSLDVGDFRSAQRRLAAHYGSDKATVNPSRVFRLPGSLHQKREPQLVTFESFPSNTLDPLQGLPELPPVKPASEAVGEPVPLDHLREILKAIPCDVTYPDWRDRVAAIHATNAGTEEERYALAQEWSRTDDLDPDGRFDHVWETMPPRIGGVGYGTLYHLAKAGGYTGGSPNHQPSPPASQLFPVASAWRSFRETAVAPTQPLRETIPGLIEQGITTFLSGVGGVNKSRLAVQWGLSLDAGLPIWGNNVIKSTFIYLSYEDHPDEVTRRVQSIMHKLHITPDMLSDNCNWADFRTDPHPLATIGDEVIREPFWDQLGEKLSAISGPKFVVFDSTYDILRFVGQAKINETAVGEAINLLDRFAFETNSTQLCLWHPSQAGAERADASGWSVAWHNKPRARLAMEASKDAENVYNLRVTKRNNAPMPKEPIQLHWMEGTLMPLSDKTIGETKVRVHEACIAVATELAEQGNPVQANRGVPDWALPKVKLLTGYQPTIRELRNELSIAGNEKRMIYYKARKPGEATGWRPLTSPSAPATPAA